MDSTVNRSVVVTNKYYYVSMITGYTYVHAVNTIQSELPYLGEVTLVLTCPNIYNALCYEVTI